MGFDMKVETLTPAESIFFSIVVTSPAEARAVIDGTIFEGSVPHDELPELRRTRCVTQALLVEGENRVRIQEPSGKAPPRFEPVAPTLEDAYLLMMRNGTVGSDASAIPAAQS